MKPVQRPTAERAFEVIATVVDTEQVGRREYTPEQRAAAREVMREARRIATFEDERTSVAVTFDDFIFRADSQERYRLIRSIADADAVLSGRTRIIRFFRTDGKQIGQAGPSRGVRLID